MFVTTAWRSQHLGKFLIALKLLKEAKEYDGDVSNTNMDNTMFNACEKDDQWSIELKMLVEHGEGDNISFSSVSRACAVDKQREKELAVFRSMGEKCVEKTLRSNSVLLNALRRKPAAASGLQQAETGCAMEQEWFQSQHASILEPGATAQQSFSSSHEESMQVNKMSSCKRGSNEDDDDVRTIRLRSELELYEEVSEELTSGKRIRNSAWLDSQEKSGVSRSALAVNQVRGACKCENVFVGKRKIMRKDETIWKLLKAVHGAQVASLRWQRLARGTLCEDRWKVFSVPCVGNNETKHSLVVFHGDVTTILSTTAGALMQGGHWLVMWSMMREVGALPSCESEFHGKESGAVRESLMNDICRKDREQTKTLAVHCDAVASRMVQRLGARKILQCRGEMVVVATSNGRD